MSDTDINLDDIQGNIVPGFRSDFQDLIFVRFPDVARGRLWLEELYDEISSAREVSTFAQLRQLIRHPRTLPELTGLGPPRPRPDRQVATFVRTTWVNVALSAEGLDTILDGVTVGDLRFPSSFCDGMIGASLEDPKDVPNWQIRDRPGEDGAGRDRVAHALLILGADTDRDLDRERSRQMLRLATLGLTLIAPPYRGETLGGGREHFGYRDSISQPDPPVEKLVSGWPVSADVIASGEFIVGLPDEEQRSDVEGPAWARNGSYLAFRRIRQFVGRFRDMLPGAVEELADTLPPELREEPSEIAERFLAAKLVGRWPSGARLLAPATGEVPELSDPFPGADAADDRLSIPADTFKTDQYGDGCPLFSHVRRAHPRDSLDLKPRLHRILRRGIPYGKPLPDGARDTGDRGLLFLAYQSRLERGFEHIQGLWFNSLNTPEGPGGANAHGRDPIVGNDTSSDDQPLNYLFYHVRGTPPPSFRSTLFRIPRVVEVTAGGYFFAPSISAVWFLSQGQP